MPNGCLSPDELAELLAESLADDERARREAHVGTCNVCQHALLRLAGDLTAEQVRLIGNGAAAERDPGPRSGFLHRLKQVVALGDTPQPHSSTETPPEPAAAVIGEVPPVITGFEVLEELGRGGSSVVYKARQAHLNRLVALKVLHARHLSPEALRRARRGIQAIAKFKHPHIVQLFEVGEHDGLHFGVLEYLAGGTLRRRLNGAPWPARDGAAVLRTLTEAVHVIHQHGIVHRDLKTANILLAADGTAKVADFGLAKHLNEPEDLTASGDVIGTPAYMAPEQALGTGRAIGPRTDLYALGVILYELLTGRPPFHGPSRLETLYQVVHLQPLPPSRLHPDVPTDLETICLKCLRKEPDLRYASARALAEDLGRFLNGEPIRARPYSAWERARKWVRRRPVVALLTALLALVTVLGSASLLAERRVLKQAHAEAVRERQEFEESLHRTEAALADAEAALYNSRIELARRARAANNLAEAQTWLRQCLPGPGQADRRGPEWFDLWRQCQDGQQP
jgi:serine/threonine protein kinase